MTKIAWITDSTSGLTQEEAAKHNIFCVPLIVLFGEESYRDGVDITIEQFYSRIEKGELPKTSQPSVGDFVALYKELKRKGYEKGIAVHLSSKLSGTHNTSQMAAEMAGFEVEVIDSKITSYPIIQMLLDGKRLEEEGKSFDEIVSFLREYPDRISTYVILDNLEYVHRGGRMNAAQYILGSLLQVKPILYFPDGSVGVFEKVRTFKKAKNRIFELLSEFSSDNLRLCVAHTNVVDQAFQWKKEIKERFSNFSVTVADLGPVIGVHGGPGTIGLTWIR
ncbi:DegV family protein [Effusibacillus consociatus]|uniref:DegV family protein n=1 Tax=Effusibacillus consociatus TaxID=1117041 RepID=A0ABV9Q7V4_9BACL